MYDLLFMGARIVACDTETTGLDYHGSYTDHGHYPARPFAFSFTTYDFESWYVEFPVDPYTRRVMYETDVESFAKLKRFYEDETITKVFHNANFDVSVIERTGIAVKGPIIDTLVLEHVKDSSHMTYALKPLTKSLFGYPDDDEKDLKKAVDRARRAARKKGYCVHKDPPADYWMVTKTFAEHWGELIPLKSAPTETYAIGDTERTMGLFYNIYNSIWKEDSDYRKLVRVEHEVLYVIRSMQDRGIRVDLEKAEELRLYYNDIIDKNTKKKAKLGFGDLNPRSSKQMREVFYGKFKLPVEVKKKKDKYGNFTESITTDSTTLDKWHKQGNELAGAILQISAASHELNTFVDTFNTVSVKTPEGDILCPNYKSIGPKTARISCTKPNLMNISSDKSKNKKTDVSYRSRECFIPRKGNVLIMPDYSQIEIWVAAFGSKDPYMCDYLLSGGDLHRLTAEKCYGHRDDFEKNFDRYRYKAKTINFGAIYEIGPGALSKQLECDYDEAKTSHTLFWRTYSGLREFADYLQRVIKSTGYITNAFGRRYYINDPMFAYKAANYYIQGSSAEIIKRAMINVYNYLQAIGFGDLLLTIHDELIIELPRDKCTKPLMRNIVKCMQSDFHKYVGVPNPMKVSMEMTYTNWGEKKEVEL